MENREKRVSIALATYNGEMFLREQLDSILNQSVRNFELVICDDCSKDSTWDILNEYAIADSRIRILRNDKNLGFLGNFEKAIQHTQEKFVALADQDDIWLPNHLEILLYTIGDKILACGNAELIDKEGKSLHKLLDYQEALDCIPENDLEKAYSVLFFRSPYQGASMLIKKEFFDLALPILREAKAHDAWFAELACFYGGINYTKSVITLYRQHGNNCVGDARLIRNSRVKSFIGQLLHNQLSNRAIVIDQILSRVPFLSEEQHLFLKKSLSLFLIRSSFFGRVKNAFFIMKHYKKIYSCK